jgi:hypothetical protein
MDVSEMNFKLRQHETRAVRSSAEHPVTARCCSRHVQLAALRWGRFCSQRDES